MTIAAKLRQAQAKQAEPKGPLWQGPHKDGITYSMLCRFLSCRERFRVAYIEGLQPAPVFNARMEFGNMWHSCEEALAKGESKYNKVDQWELLNNHCQSLYKRFPMQREQIQHWESMCRAMFPIYADYWRSHPDVTERIPLFQEQVFDVSYKLPSNRTVRLRGKWDAVDLIGKGKGAGVYLQENKTKSQIDGAKISRHVAFDLQSMLYLVALEITRTDRYKAPLTTAPTKGVRYNVIRRSAHKSVESMLKKLQEDKQAGRIGEWFARWKVDITPEDIGIFRRQCLDPLLEQVCDWWAWINGSEDKWGAVGRPNSLHWRHPFGIYNPMDAGGESDLDAYLETGSRVGLQRADRLFKELSDEV